MTSAENISKISIANSTKSSGKAASSKKIDTAPEDLGLGIVEETAKAAADAARNAAKELQAENKTIKSGIKALANAATKIANKLLKLEDKINETDTTKYEQEVKQLQAQQKEYQNDIKDAQQQITVNNQAAQEAEEKAEIEDKKAEDAKKEAEEKAEIETKEQETIIAKENKETADNDIQASETAEETELPADNETETVQEVEDETSREITEIEDENQGITDETEIEEPFIPVDTILPPLTEETELPEEIITQPEIEEIIQEETNTYYDNIVEETPVIGEEFNANDLAQEIKAAEIVEAVQTYEEIGVAVDAETLVKATVTELDAIVETAVVQEVLKTTATGKKMGATANIKTKKEMKENKEAVDDFQANFITLQSYYNANDVYNVAAEGFITLANEMYTNLTQGATYDTSKLNEASSTAVNLTSTIQSDVANGTFAIQDTDGQYEEIKNEATDALCRAQDAVGKNNENKSLNELEAEFLTVTSNYRNATADSEKQDTITKLSEIIAKAGTIEENPESKINMDERLVVTL